MESLSECQTRVHCGANAFGAHVSDIGRPIETAKVACGVKWSDVIYHHERCAGMPWTPLKMVQPRPFR